jgi:REP element-mobilizing transposase RayT
VPHARRPPLEARHPVHVTVKVVREVGYLRGFRIYPAVRRALCGACDRLDTRIVHFSVQSDHIHLLIETRDQIALGKAMKGFGVRLARRLNRTAGRSGRVVADRYHARYLRNPTEVRRGLLYVLQNGIKHGRTDGALLRSGQAWFDPFSSAAYFHGWHERCRRWIPPRDAHAHPLHCWGVPSRPVAAPRTWLLREGWRRGGGPIDPSERPALETADIVSPTVVGVTRDGARHAAPPPKNRTNRRAAATSAAATSAAVTSAATPSAAVTSAATPSAAATSAPASSAPASSAPASSARPKRAGV